MAEKKITKRDNFTTIRSILAELDRADLVAIMDHELELLDRKNAKTNKTPTDQQKKNAETKNQIVALLKSENRAMSATEIQTSLNIETNQRATALIRQLKDEGLVKREVVKGKALFTAE